MIPKLPVLLCALTLATPVFAQTAIDGDTIKLDGTTYRLWGIDAPESKQACGGWAAGADATRTFVDLMKGKQIECEPKTTDRYGRTVAICRADGADLGMAMVSAGMAWAFVRYSQDYVLQESEAKLAGLGIHSHGCEPAWEWRARQRPKG